MGALDRRHGPGVFVIAEIGCNHDGRLELAHRMIDVAARAGADAAKFQTFVPAEMITRGTPKANYQIGKTNPLESPYQRLERMRLDLDAHRKLRDHCATSGITFCSSAFDVASADLLESLGVPFFKIPSGELTNLPLLRHIAAFGKPMVISTGMADLGEIEEALDAVGPAVRAKSVLLHCVSDYPADWSEANLRAMRTLGEAFKMRIGFSDHTEGIELPLVAVGLGATVIEKHLTLDKTMEGGDHKASLEPTEFTELVTKIRAVERALGDGVKRCAPSEENVRAVARKSVVARRLIPKGTRIEADMLALKRPGTGIAPKHLPAIVGRQAREDLETDRIIEWQHLT
jgi:N-acetylneuraminate synthase/N,N'-diacetyllegionaminate synthase